MSWEYRVIRKQHKHPDGSTEDQFAIHEVCYNNAGSIDAWSRSPMYVCGETFEELKSDVEHYVAALTKPVLNWDELGEI